MATASIAQTRKSGPVTRDNLLDRQLSASHTIKPSRNILAEIAGTGRSVHTAWSYLHAQLMRILRYVTVNINHLEDFLALDSVAETKTGTKHESPRTPSISKSTQRGEEQESESVVGGCIQNVVWRKRN